MPISGIEIKTGSRWREKLLLALALPVLLWSGYYRKSYKPGQREMRKLSSSIRSLELEISKIEEERPGVFLEERKLAHLESKRAAVGGKIKSMQGRFFGKEEIPMVVQLLIEQIGPSTDLIYMRAKPIQKEGFLEEFQIQISFVSSYYESLMYVDSIERLSPLIRIDDFSMSLDKDVPGIRTYIAVSALLCGAKKEERTQVIFANASAFSEVKDLFVSPVAEEEDLQIPEKDDLLPVRLQGIIWGKESVRTAVINGKVLRPGDEVEGSKLIAIEKDRVVLRKDDREYLLVLKISEED